MFVALFAYSDKTLGCEDKTLGHGEKTLGCDEKTLFDVMTKPLDVMTNYFNAGLFTTQQRPWFFVENFDNMSVTKILQYLQLICDTFLSNSWQFVNF